jgi:50S ribosomal subunit-associated GTPase HflX
MDFSHPNVLAQRDNVYETLENLKIQKSLMDNILNVGNKLDKCDSARREELMKLDLLAPTNGPAHTILPISCRTAEGIPELIHRVDKVSFLLILQYL